MRKVGFPRMVVPLAVTVVGTFNLLLNLVVLAVFLALNGVAVRWSWLLVPIPLVLVGVFATGTGLLLAALFVRFRDIKPIWDVVLQALFYATPILYPVQLVQEKSESLTHVLMANPLATLIQETRYLLLGDATPSAAAAIGGTVWLLVPAAIIVVVTALGFSVFERTAPHAAEELRRSAGSRTAARLVHRVGHQRLDGIRRGRGAARDREEDLVRGFIARKACSRYCSLQKSPNFSGQSRGYSYGMKMSCTCTITPGFRRGSDLQHDVVDVAAELDDVRRVDEEDVAALQLVEDAARHVLRGDAVQAVEAGQVVGRDRRIRVVGVDLAGMALGRVLARGLRGHQRRVAGAELDDAPWACASRTIAYRVVASSSPYEGFRR